MCCGVDAFVRNREERMRVFVYKEILGPGQRHSGVFAALRAVTEDGTGREVGAAVDSL